MHDGDGISSLAGAAVVGPAAKLSFPAEVNCRGRGMEDHGKIKRLLSDNFSSTSTKYADLSV
jgi:hypothetical protein